MKLIISLILILQFLSACKGGEGDNNTLKNTYQGESTHEVDDVFKGDDDYSEETVNKYLGVLQFEEVIHEESMIICDSPTSMSLELF